MGVAWRSRAEHTHTHIEREDWGMLAKVLRLSQETIGVEVKCGWVVCLPGEMVDGYTQYREESLHTHIRTLTSLQHKPPATPNIYMYIHKM
jgi:hypothetical protein